jgi:putative lipoprotein (rSAM/lipoprotein system)
VKTFARLGLKLLTLFVPVTIAACYGGPVRFSACGKIVDAQSQAPIAGVEVRCTDGTTTGTPSFSYAGEPVNGWSSGDFCADADTPSQCTSLLFTDVDGATNGTYQTKTVAVPDDASSQADMAIELSQ